MITIRHIDRTALLEEPFVKLVKKYSHQLEHDILIVFDKRISCLGMHTYNHKKQLHTIRISPIYNLLDPAKNIKFDYGAELHNVISTLLHELKHAHQRESLKKSALSVDYCVANDILNPEMAEYYSTCELEAREYECKNISKAVEYFNSCCA